MRLMRGISRALTTGDVMSILKIEMLGRDRVMVSELMTLERLVGEASSLAEEGMHAQASLYTAIAGNAKKSGKAVWDTVFTGRPVDLGDREFRAMLAAQHSGLRRAIVCVY
jgi:hypothetical protein